MVEVGQVLNSHKPLACNCMQRAITGFSPAASVRLYTALFSNRGRCLFVDFVESSNTVALSRD
jgi:hypothetical protein